MVTREKVTRSMLVNNSVYDLNNKLVTKGSDFKFTKVFSHANKIAAIDDQHQSHYWEDDGYSLLPFENSIHLVLANNGLLSIDRDGQLFTYIKGVLSKIDHDHPYPFLSASISTYILALLDINGSIFAFDIGCRNILIKDFEYKNEYLPYVPGELLSYKNEGEPPLKLSYSLKLGLCLEKKLKVRRDWLTKDAIQFNADEPFISVSAGQQRVYALTSNNAYVCGSKIPVENLKDGNNICIKLNLPTKFASLVSCDTNLTGLDYEGKLWSAYVKHTSVEQLENLKFVNPSKGCYVISDKEMKRKLDFKETQVGEKLRIMYEHFNCSVSSFSFDKIIISQISAIEDSILVLSTENKLYNTDFPRFSASDKYQLHWRKKYKYKSKDDVILPNLTTISKKIYTNVKSAAF